MEPIKVLIVDDHPVVRDGISAMLARERDIKVVGDAQNGLVLTSVSLRNDA